MNRFTIIVHQGCRQLSEEAAAYYMGQDTDPIFEAEYTDGSALWYAASGLFPQNFTDAMITDADDHTIDAHYAVTDPDTDELVSTNTTPVLDTPYPPADFLKACGFTPTATFALPWIPPQ